MGQDGHDARNDCVARCHALASGRRPAKKLNEDRLPPVNGPGWPRRSQRLRGTMPRPRQRAEARQEKMARMAMFFVYSVDVLAARLEVLPEVAGPLDVAILGVEFDAPKLLEMGGLGANQQ